MSESQLEKLLKTLKEKDAEIKRLRESQFPGKIMYSWDFIEENPTITVAWAMNILGNHGYDDVFDTWDNELHCQDVVLDDATRFICKIDNGNIDTQELFDWLGY